MVPIIFHLSFLSKRHNLHSKTQILWSCTPVLAIGLSYHGTKSHGYLELLVAFYCSQRETLNLAKYLAIGLVFS